MPDFFARQIFDANRDWVSHHHAAWRQVCRRWVGVAGVQFLEIGCLEGRSACWWCENVLTGEGAQLTCVDAWEWDWSGPTEEKRFDHNTSVYPVRKLKGRTTAVLPSLYLAGNWYDMVYVDGDHRAASCLFDCVLGWQLLKPGGLLIADDYLWTHPTVQIPPQAAIDGFVAAYADEIRHVSHSQCGQVFVWK